MPNFHLISHTVSLVLASTSPYLIIADASLGSATCQRKRLVKQLLKQLGLATAYSVFPPGLVFPALQRTAIRRRSLGNSHCRRPFHFAKFVWFLPCFNDLCVQSLEQYLLPRRLLRPSLCCAGFTCKVQKRVFVLRHIWSDRSTFHSFCINRRR